ncbi:amidohydrolase family protein [Desulfonatronospira sp.]|uniref:amidohydrolase family protein n=1 Tax=Desulfonatronospira sp. TaxID=1962951 RepID=UPI0025C01345|nr:amidohydrolase family protein [Desulfonatronospira sp.]
MQCVRADTIYTGRQVVQDACLAFDDSGIVGVFPEVYGEIIRECRVITPAFIDPHSHIGMVRAGEPRAEAESNDRQDPILVMADALDSLQMDDQALQEAVEAGVLYSCILPGSGNIIGGNSAIIRNYASDSTRALLGRAGLKAALGYNPMSTTSWNGSRPTTRMGALAMLRNRLDEVLVKEKRRQVADQEKKKEIVLSAEEETLLQVLQGELVLRVHVHKIDDIAALLRLVDEFSLRVSVEHAMGVHHADIFKELARRGIPVVYGPVDAFAYKVELKHENWRNLKHLLESGVEYGLMTDHPVTPARQLFLQTRWFLRLGLSRQEVVEILTRQNAALLGLQDRLGTLEKGKWASFVCWGGDPFDLAGFPVAVYGEGSVVYSAGE